MKTGEQRRLSIFSSLAEVRLLVRFCRDSLEHLFSESELASIELAVVEAANNIVQHAYNFQKDQPLQISIFHRGDYIEIEFYDKGQVLNYESVEPPQFHWDEIEDVPEGGWGIYLIKKLMDNVIYERYGNINIFKLIKKLPEDKIQDTESFYEIELRDRRRAEDRKRIEELENRLQESELACEEMVAELSTAYESLNLFYKLSRDTALISNLTDFLHNTMQYLLAVSNTKWAVIRLLENDTLKLATHAGNCPKEFLIDEINLSDISNIEAQAASNPEVIIKKSTITEEVLLCLPIIGLNEFLGTILLGNHIDSEGLSTGKIKLVRGMADQVAVSIENKKLYTKAMNAELARQEMLLATNLQKKLILKKHPQVKNLKFYSKAEPAQQVGGDYITIEKLSDSKAVIIVCDAMGKGMSASFFSLMSHMAFHSILEQQDKSNITPGKLLSLANRIMFREFDLFCMFMTAFVGIIDTEQETLTYASAGHCQPIIYIPDIGIELLDTDDYMMGVEQNLEYHNFCVTFSKGMKVLVYSDGLTDFTDINGNIVGLEPLQKLCMELFQKYDITESCERIFKETVKLSGKILQDDIAIIGIESI
jgi:sigma-B regulation protein RsbU (phosphoserine phosphatase)